MRAVFSAMQRVDWQMGCLLRTFFGMRLFLDLGFATSAAYIGDRLGISPRKARSLVRIERKGFDCGRELNEAYREGRLSWLRALTLLPILSDSNADQWIARAQQVTLSRLAREVEWARDMQDRSLDWLPIAPPPLGTELDFSDEQVRRQVCSRLDPCVMDRLRNETPESDAVIAFAAPASVTGLLGNTMSGFSRPGEAAWRGFERLLAHAEAEWGNVPRHRNPIYARDGWRCQVPACTSRRNLQEHHIIYRSRGGGNLRENRIAICVSHHLHVIHRELVRLRGNANAEVMWEIGVRPGHTPLMRLQGDVYVAAAEIDDGDWHTLELERAA
jgi:hypothetical protein